MQIEEASSMVVIEVEIDRCDSVPAKIKRINKDSKAMEVKLGEADCEIDGAEKTVKKRRVSKCSYIKRILHEHRSRLVVLIDKLARKHEWSDASGALSVLLKGTPRGCSLMEDRKHFLLAMELVRRFPNSQDYTRRIKQIFEVWMSKLPWARKCCMKKHLIQMELALFCLMQGNIREAHHTMKFLAQDRESRSDPHVHLIHGLTSYQLWYSELPQEMQLKDFDVFTQPEVPGMASCGGFPQQIGLVGMPSDHNSADIQYAEIFAQSNSESSIGNEKIQADCDLQTRSKRSHQDDSSHEFYMTGSAITDETRVVLPSMDSNQANVSIFHAQGLDACLLPIRLEESTEDLEFMILSHKKLLNEHYIDAVKHLRAALHSNPPMLSALHPLIQLLLIGDQVEEALKELNDFFHTSKSMLPLRYKARLLECLGNGQYMEFAKCYEQIVEIEPSHVPSLQRLISLHMNGNYGTVRLMEYLAMHLDHTDGISSMWEELASCFLKIQSLQLSEYEEDEESTMRPIHFSSMACRSTTPRKIPRVFLRGEARNMWTYRCKWWSKRHFSKAIYMSEIQTGDFQRLAYKAACACHLYGPDFQYVRELLCKGGRDQISFLRRHMDSSLKLCEALTAGNPL
ncbi:unnamed protein product [Spirodela intermedia]|uniref:Uncharacterized protein n=1 Tax=Spirodela intermedia TaxID=51605 RepID=A0A7I8L7H3_SPIIN|nr:unnamed protein product [Spirodela intermedia]